MNKTKLTALAAAMIASFSANAELQSLNDNALENVTGQEGITMVVKAEITNLDLAYTDGDTKGGTLGFDGIKTDALSITQTIDIVDKDTVDTAIGGSITLKDATNDRVLAMGIDGIKGTFTVGAIRVGSDVNTAIGTDVNADKPAGDANFHTGRASSLGSLTLGNLTTSGGIKQYIFAH